MLFADGDIKEDFELFHFIGQDRLDELDVGRGEAQALDGFFVERRGHELGIDRKTILIG